MRLKLETGFGGEIILSDLNSNDCPHVFMKTEELFEYLLIRLEHRYNDERPLGRPFGKVTIERRDRT